MNRFGFIVNPIGNSKYSMYNMLLYFVRCSVVDEKEELCGTFTYNPNAGLIRCVGRAVQNKTGRAG